MCLEVFKNLHKGNSQLYTPAQIMCPSLSSPLSSFLHGTYSNPSQLYSNTWYSWHTQMPQSSPHLVYGDTVHIGVVHKPDDLVREQLSIVLWRQVRLSWFTGVKLQAFPDSFSQHVQCRVRLHDLRHRLLNQGLHTREPVAERTDEKRRGCQKELSLFKNTFR